MPTYIDSWAQAAQELGVTLISPPVTIPSGLEMYPMLVPYFGTEKGTFVFSEMQPKSVVDELRDNGYTCSIFSQCPEGYRVSVENLVEILSDWGWSGPENRRPSWVKDERSYE